MDDSTSRNDQSPEAVRPAIAAHFATVAAAGSRGPIGELASLLSSGVLLPAAFRAHADRHGARNERWFKLQVLDLALGFIESALDDGTLTLSEVADIRALNAFLDISAKDFLECKPAEVAALLGAQLERILEDEEITTEEDLYQVELQAAFGIGYDDYLALTRRAFERAHVDLTFRAGGSDSTAVDARRRLAALEPIYRLASLQRRSLGALY